MLVSFFCSYEGLFLWYTPPFVERAPRHLGARLCSLWLNPALLLSRKPNYWGDRDFPIHWKLSTVKANCYCINIKHQQQTKSRGKEFLLTKQFVSHWLIDVFCRWYLFYFVSQSRTPPGEIAIVAITLQRIADYRLTGDRMMIAIRGNATY